MNYGALVAAAFISLSAVPACAQPDLTPQDEIAWRILFQLMRTRPEGTWNVKAQALWLQNHGVPGQFFFPIQKTADKYWSAVIPFEEDLRNIHVRYAGRNNSTEAAEAARPAREKISEQLRLAVRDLETALGVEGSLHLRRLISEVKQRMRPAGTPGGDHIHERK
jgi:hypothetical protein